MKIKFTDGFLDDCERLGIHKTTGWSLHKIYYRLVPHRWRPGQIWYRFKCFAWHRYTTIRPRTLPYHTWHDKDSLLVHCCFEILCRFMENELGIGTKNEHLGGINWDSDDAHREALATLRELYTYWKDLTADPEWVDRLDFNPEMQAELTKQLHRLIDVRDAMWT